MSVLTHIKRRFRNLRSPPEPEGAVTMETGILVATLHHLVAAHHLGVAVETLRMLLGERSTMGIGVQTAREGHLGDERNK